MARRPFLNFSATGQAFRKQRHGGSPAPRLIETLRMWTVCATSVTSMTTNTTTDADAAAFGRAGRMSRERKRDAVLRLLRGGDLELVLRTPGVTLVTRASATRR